MTTLLQTTPKSTNWNLFTMKPHHRKYLLGLMILLTFLLGVNLNAHEIQLQSENFALYSDEQVYVSPENVVITEEGIYLVNKGNIEPVRVLYRGEKGLCALRDIEAKTKDQQITNKCFRGHDIYHWDCLGCANWYCPARCKCYSPWNQND